MENITIAVSVKNRQDFIGKCIQSILDTDWPDKRIIIVDNMSTDNTSQVLKSFGNKIEVYKIEGGLSKVFNWIVNNTHTKYLAITDSDCIVDKNWIKELLVPFSVEKNLVASAGYCGTAPDSSFLQRIIGMELENRFKSFSKYISRAPTMNLCLVTEIAKEVGFDESYVYQAFEADFGYRLSKKGKIFYNSKAIIWHHHRGTLKNFFLQQKNQAKWSLKLLFTHKKQALADHITTSNMSLQLFFGLLSAIFFLLIFLYNWFFVLFIISVIILFALYIIDMLKIKPAIKYWPAFFGFYIFRTIAWMIGIIEGIILLFPKL